MHTKYIAFIEFALENYEKIGTNLNIRWISTHFSTIVRCLFAFFNIRNEKNYFRFENSRQGAKNSREGYGTNRMFISFRICRIINICMRLNIVRNATYFFNNLYLNNNINFTIKIQSTALVI